MDVPSSTDIRASRAGATKGTLVAVLLTTAIATVVFWYILIKAVTAVDAQPNPPTLITAPTALAFNPTCDAIVLLDVHIGTPFSAPYGSCYSGIEATSALWEVLTESGDNPYTNGWRVNSLGVLTNPATTPGAGRLLVRRTLSNGVQVQFPRSWRVQ